MSFESFQFKPFIYEALADSDFLEPTPIQEKIIPIVQAGKSVVGQSQTGSGKTHAFLLPLLNKIDGQIDQVQVVITAPSRELADQIYQATKQITAFSDTVRVMNLVGGTDKKRQVTRLKKQQPHVVIGTPGRILDLVNEQALFVHTAFAFVIDEADMALDLGFLPVVDQIAGRFAKDTQFLVFSATIPEKLRPFLKKYLENPQIEEIPTTTVISNTIDNWLISTKGKDPDHLIYQLLTMGEPYLAIVFANTKIRVDEIATYLKDKGLKVAKIHGDVPSRERKRVMRQVQNLEFQYVVATDLAARGIDIEGVSLVINAQLPKDLDFFVHRVGRTGRNGLSGTAITMYEPSEEKEIDALEKMGITFLPKEIKAGKIVATYRRNRRQEREKGQDPLDPQMIGKIKKSKKKVKPGYKKKIQQEITKSNQEKRKVKRRNEARTKRKQKKKSTY